MIQFECDRSSRTSSRLRDRRCCDELRTASLIPASTLIVVATRSLGYHIGFDRSPSGQRLLYKKLGVTRARQRTSYGQHSLAFGDQHPSMKSIWERPPDEKLPESVPHLSRRLAPTRYIGIAAWFH